MRMMIVLASSEREEADLEGTVTSMYYSEGRNEVNCYRHASSPVVVGHK
jgi:hypothetical protein